MNQENQKIKLKHGCRNILQNNVIEKTMNKEWFELNKRMQLPSPIARILLVAFCISMMCGCGSEKDVSSTVDTDQTTTVTTQVKTFRPQYTEEEILNMSNEDLIALGMIEIEHGVEDVRRPNTMAADLNIGSEYEQLWRRAGRSASSLEEATEIIKEEWKDMDGSEHRNIRFVTENDEFWLFACDFYYDGKFQFVFSTAVYKKSYFDNETSTAYFELNEESIRHFFAYQATDAAEDTRTCIGEYVINTENGYIFRRYLIHICYGDLGLKDQVYLQTMEWKIYENGKIESISPQDNGRVLDLPSQKLTDESSGFGE